MEKNTTKESKSYINSFVDRTKHFVLNANDIALNKTEEFVSQSLEVTAQWQQVAEKAIKGGLRLSSNQQELVFEILNEVKADLKEGKKKINALLS